MRANEVIDEIRAAFSNVTLGDGIGLWEAQVIDDYESIKVQKQRRGKDEKRDWSSLSYAELQRCHSSLSFFDANGMRFHLPAFMIGSIKDELDDPIFHLTQLDDYAKSKLTTLNESQRNAVVVFLSWCLGNDHYQFEHTAIENSLNGYWSSKT